MGGFRGLACYSWIYGPHASYPHLDPKFNRSRRLLCSCSETRHHHLIPLTLHYNHLVVSTYHPPYQPSPKINYSILSNPKSHHSPTQPDLLDSATSSPSPNPIHGINQSDTSSIDPSPIRLHKTQPYPRRRHDKQTDPCLKGRLHKVAP
jgi:hypothetical protein